MASPWLDQDEAYTAETHMRIHCVHCGERPCSVNCPAWLDDDLRAEMDIANAAALLTIADHEENYH